MERDAEQQRDVCREGEHVAVREVDEPQHSEDEREPDGAESEIGAGDDAVDGRLSRIVRPLRGDEQREQE